MPNVGQFTVVRSAIFALPNPDDGVNKDIPFPLPNDTSVARSHLFWTVSSVEGQPRYAISLNGTKLLEQTVAHSEQRVMHVTTSDAIRPGENTITVERTNNSGTVRIDDIVLHFRESV